MFKLNIYFILITLIILIIILCLDVKWLENISYAVFLFHNIRYQLYFSSHCPLQKQFLKLDKSNSTPVSPQRHHLSCPNEIVTALHHRSWAVEWNG